MPVRGFIRARSPGGGRMAAGGRKLPHTPRSVYILSLFATGLLVTPSCSGDDDSDDQSEAETTTTEPVTTTTHPPAEGETQDQAFAIVEDIVLEATGLADRLFQDPEVVSDPDNEDIERLRELYTLDSPTPDGVISQLEDLANRGLRVRAAASGVFRDLGIYSLAADGPDTVRFDVCAVEDQETVNSEGQVLEVRAKLVQGVGEARRVDGLWRFYGINPDEAATRDITPGSAVAGFCDDLYAGAEPPP